MSVVPFRVVMDLGPPIEMKVTTVVPAEAGTHVRWIPAFAGMT
jgi:hypothetical protein